MTAAHPEGPVEILSPEMTSAKDRSAAWFVILGYARVRVEPFEAFELELGALWSR